MGEAHEGTAVGVGRRGAVARQINSDDFTLFRKVVDDLILQAQATGELRPDLTSDDVATFVAMVTTASVAMNQPKPLRRRYLSLMFDAFSPTAAAPLPSST